MMKKSIIAFGLSIVTLLGANASKAQAQQGQSASPAPAGIDVATARKIISAAEAAAVSLNAHVGISVVDANGDLVYFERMDGATARGVISSQGKARAAILFGVPTKDIQEAAAAGKPLSASVTAPPVGTWEIATNEGGIPIVKGGKVVAAVGVGGGSPSSTDGKIAQAGLDAILAGN